MDGILSGLNEASVLIHDAQVKKGFYDTPREVGTLLMLVVSELSEALEADRKGWHNFPMKRITKPPEVEEWRDIEGYAGEYQVSNLGNVRSLDMTVHNGVNYYAKEGRMLKARLGGQGYLTVSLKGKTYKVSRLVAKAFCNGYSETKLVNHINGIKTNDYSNNLEWVTSSENNKHAIQTGINPRNGILTKKEMIVIAMDFKLGATAKEIHARYPQVSLSAIKGISGRKEKYTQSVEFEIADTIIRLMDYAGYKGIDLEWHISQKLKYNSLRPNKHGKNY